MQSNSKTRMNQTEIMLELLRSSVLDNVPVIPETVVIDWDGLMDISAEQGVLAWVWDGICKLPPNQRPPRLQSINWGLSAQEVWDTYCKQLMVLEGMVNTCQENNVRLLLLKGIGLSRLYPKPESRQSSDIDIYLFDDYEKGNRLFTGHDIKRIDKHASFQIDTVLIENHYTFFEPNTRQKKRILKYINSTLDDVRLTSYGYYVLCPMADMVFLTLHTLKHFTEERLIQLKNIVDFAMYLHTYRNSLPSDKCFNILSELGLVKGFEMLVCMSEIITGLNYSMYHYNLLPADDVKEIKKILISNYTYWERNSNPFSRRSEAHCIFKYIPRNISYYTMTIQFLSRWIRLLCKIPANVSIKAWLRER